MKGAALEPHEPMPDVSVVICAYTEERWEPLLAAVGSVRAQSVPAREVIVVVDHDDGLLARAREAITDAVVVANEHARGLSGARNTGMALASGAVVAFLDDDARAGTDWLARLGAAYADPAVLGVGGKVRADWDHGRPDWFPAEFDWVVGCTHSGLPSEAAPVRNLVGANMSFRRDVLDGLGGFRDGLGRVGKVPLGCEETELCIRASQRWSTGRIVYLPEATVEHTVPASRASVGYFVSRCHAEGRSKALVSRLVGTGDGLEAERSYVRSTLPRGVARGLGDAARGDLGGLGRSVAIVVGLATTALGYVGGQGLAGLGAR